MKINIKDLITNNRVITLLHNECGIKIVMLKDDMLKKEEIRATSSRFETINFKDIELVIPNIESNYLFDKHRYNNYDLYNIYTRNNKTNKLEKFVYTLAVLGSNTGTHKDIETVIKENKEMDNIEILEILGEI